MCHKINCLASIFIIFFLSIMLLSVKSILSCSSALASSNMLNVKNHKLLTSIPNQNIKLYAVDWNEAELKHTDTYKEVLLDIKGKQRYFPCWIVDTNESFTPTLTLSDINNDGKKELIVISTSATGTGVLIQEVHIFNVDTFTEIHAVNPIDAIYHNVNTNITKENGIVTISLNVKGTTFTAKAKEYSTELWLENIHFGNCICYYVNNNKLYAELDAQAGASLFAGKITFDYVYKDNMMDTNNIRFDKFKDNNALSWSMPEKISN